MTRNPQGYYIIQIKDKRLRGERMSISSRTSDLTEARARKADVKNLIEWGDSELLEALRGGNLHIASLRKAVKNQRQGSLDQLRTEHADTGGAPTTMGDGMEYTLSTVRTTGRENTIALYETVDRHMGPIRDRPIAEFLTRDAQAFLDQPRVGKGKRKRAWASNTRRLYRTLMKRVANDSIRAELEVATAQKRPPRYSLNPWDAVRLPESEKTRMTVLSHEEWLRLADTLADTPELALLAVMGLGGLRLAEARHLRRKDVDLKEGVLRIREHKMPFVPWKPKKKRSTRKVAMMPELRAILRQHIMLGYAGDRYLFVAPGNDRPISDSEATRRVRQAFDAAEIAYGTGEGEATAHSLRHTAATWMIMAGVPITVVAAQLGDTPAVILSTYAHAFPDSQADAAAAVSRALQEAATLRSAALAAQRGTGT